LVEEEKIIRVGKEKRAIIEVEEEAKRKRGVLKKTRREKKTR